MLQIISGTFARRVLQQPPAAITRPVSEKVRGAIFNSLASGLDGARVLDLFAGSGALGLEALSRGAAQVDFVEKNNKVASVLKQNIAILGVREAATVHVGSVERFFEQSNEAYEFVLMDPPYADFEQGMVEQAVGLLQYGGTLVVSTSSKANLVAPSGTELNRQKTYGDTMITVLKKV